MLRYVLRHVVFSALLGALGNDLVSGETVVAAAGGSPEHLWQGCGRIENREACRTLRLRGAGTAKVVSEREDDKDAGGTEGTRCDGCPGRFLTHAGGDPRVSLLVQEIHSNEYHALQHRERNVASRDAGGGSCARRCAVPEALVPPDPASVPILRYHFPSNNPDLEAVLLPKTSSRSSSRLQFPISHSQRCPCIQPPTPDLKRLLPCRKRERSPRTPPPAGSARL